jgi:hypothetical protein
MAKTFRKKCNKLNNIADKIYKNRRLPVAAHSLKRLFSIMG